MHQACFRQTHVEKSGQATFSPPTDVGGRGVCECGFWPSAQLCPSLGLLSDAIKHFPSLSLLSYCQTNSSGKGKSSNNNVLVDLTHRIGQAMSLRHLTYQTCYTDRVWSRQPCPHVHIDGSRLSLNNMLPFPKSARRHISD